LPSTVIALAEVSIFLKVYCLPVIPTAVGNVIEKAAVVASPVITLSEIVTVYASVLFAIIVAIAPLT